MGKLTIMLPDDVEDELRDYIRSKFKRPFGKLSSVIAEAVKKKLEEEIQ